MRIQKVKVEKKECRHPNCLANNQNKSYEGGACDLEHKFNPRRDKMKVQRNIVLVEPPVYVREERLHCANSRCGNLYELNHDVIEARTHYDARDQYDDIYNLAQSLRCQNDYCRDTLDKIRQTPPETAHQNLLTKKREAWSRQKCPLCSRDAPEEITHVYVANPAEKGTQEFRDELTEETEDGKFKTLPPKAMDFD